ncbi:MAG: hypothetical protein HC896_14460 [Bacteroidales bacterium]|nr:hypothetical protein [Bacteroidales bacterium]
MSPLAKSKKNKKCIIEFDGIYKDADVWVNNVHAGFHKNGYLSFFYDITELLKPDTINSIKIRVDNSDLPHDRWYSGCGIYRHTWINFVNDIHIPIWGTYITTPFVSEDSATIHIALKVQAGEHLGDSISIHTVITDKYKRQVAEGTNTRLVIDTFSVEQQFSLPKPCYGRSKTQICIVPNIKYIYTEN